MKLKLQAIAIKKYPEWFYKTVDFFIKDPRFIHIKKEFPSGDYYYIVRIKGDKSDPGWSYIPHGCLELSIDGGCLVSMIMGNPHKEKWGILLSELRDQSIQLQHQIVEGDYSKIPELADDLYFMSQELEKFKNETNA